MLLYDITQAGKALRLAPITIRRMIRAGEIPHHKLGGKYLFTPEDLSAFLQAAAVPAKTAKEVAHE